MVPSRGSGISDKDNCIKRVDIARASFFISLGLLLSGVAIRKKNQTLTPRVTKRLSKFAMILYKNGFLK